MASIVPKIKIGLGASKREKHNLSFDCATTANIGSVQPTMCREMVPKSTFKVKVASLVRLASMPVPTFGRMSLRHYHTFVKYADLWQPFDAMMSGQHYVGGSSGSSFIPSTLPWYTMAGGINHWIRAYSDISIAHVDHPDEPYTITDTNEDWNGVVYNPSDYNDSMTEAIKAAQAADLARLQAGWSAIRSNVKFGHDSSVGTMFPFGKGDIKEDAYGVVNAGNFYAAVPYNIDTLAIAYDTVPSGNVTHYLTDGNTPITREGADLITEVGDYIVYFKFKPFVKRLRTIIIGLGDQFSPYSTVEHSLIKLLAYYKAWFNLFSPNRERAFIDTPCYKLIKYLSDRNGEEVPYTKADFRLFIQELGSSCYYYLPMDYYSMSVMKPAAGNQDTNFTLQAGNTSYAPNLPNETRDLVIAHKNGDFDAAWANVTLNGQQMAQNPLAIKLAFRMLKWANKNTVIGRSVRQYLKVHFGVDDVNAIDDGGVYRIGSSRTNIQISDVMSTAESKEGYLGEYAGRGIGYGDSESFDFTADNFGCWITLTAVVPESGYYQGYLKENRHLTRYQFFNPEYDALGYQVLERGEIMDDYNCDGVNWNPVTQFDRTAAFGFVPRYSEYKVGRNIVNGDLSLVGLYGSMAPYTLDRRIAGGEIGVNSYAVTGSAIGRVKKPTWVPICVYDAFRRIDPTDHLGQYNRIFNYGGNDLDHFIINNVFDVQCWAPMKSLTDSFDTVAEDEKTIKLTHS